VALRGLHPEERVGGVHDVGGRHRSQHIPCSAGSTGGVGVVYAAPGNQSAGAGTKAVLATAVVVCSRTRINMQQDALETVLLQRPMTCIATDSSTARSRASLLPLT
jgi:hypothetical protein